MPLPISVLVQLSSVTDHGTVGKIVKFFCFGSGKYELEKHTHDHELYMRKCDADLIRLLISIYYKDIKKYVEDRQVRSANAPEAIKMLELCMNGFSANGATEKELQGFEPYSKELLYTCASYLVLALRELDPEPVAHAPHSLTKLYLNLFHLAQCAEKRYEVEVYVS